MESEPKHLVDQLQAAMGAITTASSQGTPPPPARRRTGSAKEVLRYLGAPNSGTQPSDRASLLLGAMIGASPDQVPEGPGSILELLVDPELTVEWRERVPFLLGVVLPQVWSATDHSAFDIIVDPDSGIDLTSRTLLLLGVATERWSDQAGALPPHRLFDILGEPWSTLGYLVADDLPVDAATRALFLLGTVVERSGTPVQEVLAHLGNNAWQMSVGDKAVILLLSAALRPRMAIDAGTFAGGSAAALSAYCDRVVSIDRDPRRGASVAPFDNVEFRCGTAADVVGEVLVERPETTLVVLDADHGEDGIVAEVASVLRHRSDRLRALVIHDAAMASCRRGLESIAWDDEPSVRGLSLDFLPGSLNDDGELVGGLALAWVSSGDPRLPSAARGDDAPPFRR